MNKIITKTQAITFFNVSNNYLEKNKEETKLTKCIKSILKQLERPLKEYNEQIEEASLNNCLVDDKTKKIIFNDKGGYEFTVENKKKLAKEIELILKEEVVIHKRILPENNEFILQLTDFEKEVFSDIVIDEINDDFEKQFE